MSKRVVAVSALPFGSTGRIMQGIAHEVSQNGYTVDMFVSTGAKAMYPDSRIADINTRCGNRLAINLSKLTGLEGCFAVGSTRKLIKRIEALSPDILHLHILHHAYINLPLLFRYLKKKNLPIVWTLHDCWAFTGHCPHFAYEKCEKWKSGCFGCSRYHHYPYALYDNSRFMWRWKKEWFSGLQNVTFVTPSHWLADLLQDSFLKDYPCYTIHNGVDLEVFKPTEGDVRTAYGIDGDKKIVLGVASAWSERKGLDVFVELAKRLPETYQIVLVGTNDQIDSTLPESIFTIHRTEDQHALAQLYTAADVFVNPTREDTFPTVNMEALACGTPVITFQTGGSPESVDDTCGVTVPCDDTDALEREIRRVCEQKPFTEEACLKKAACFESAKQFRQYIDVYQKAVGATSQNKRDYV